ncbi:major capsid protein [Caudoviricetes sp.]|nr:major capsid protein [Caudoviricetes sp.]
MKKNRLVSNPSLGLMIVAAGCAMDARRRNLGRAKFADLVQGGISSFQEGTVADQTRLLQIAVDGLGVYNANPDPIVERMSTLVTRETVKVSQAPKEFNKYADGSSGLRTRSVRRLLSTPLLSYHLADQFTVEALMDMREDDLMNEVDTAIRGDADLVNSLFWYSMLTKKTAGSVSSAYIASFYNGETDVPPYRQNAFASAHYHYKGSNTSDFTKAVFDEMIADVQEHGYGLEPGTLELAFHSSSNDDVNALFNSASNILQAGTPSRQTAIDRGVRAPGVLLNGVALRPDDYVPAGYFALYATNEQILNRREHETEQFRGLMLFREGGFSPEFPLAGTQFMRRIGFSARHLGAATFRQIVGSTTYTNPTFRHPACS